MRKAYQSDLSDAEWSYLEPHLPVPEFTGRPKTHSTREILNAIPTFMCVLHAASLNDAQEG